MYRKGLRRERVEPSPQFDGKTFRNPLPADVDKDAVDALAFSLFR